MKSRAIAWMAVNVHAKIMCVCFNVLIERRRKNHLHIFIIVGVSETSVYAVHGAQTKNMKNIEQWKGCPKCNVLTFNISYEQWQPYPCCHSRCHCRIWRRASSAPKTRKSHRRCEKSKWKNMKLYLIVVWRQLSTCKSTVSFTGFTEVNSLLLSLVLFLHLFTGKRARFGPLKCSPRDFCISSTRIQTQF